MGGRSAARGSPKATPVIALCGKLSATPEQIETIGLKAAYCINPEERPLAEMLANTAANLEETARKLPIQAWAPRSG